MKDSLHNLLKRSAILGFSCLLAAPLAVASCLNDVRLTGVNLAGAEFHTNKLPGNPEKDYAYPKESELSYIAAQGANVVRLPFRWERIQHQILSPLDTDEVKRLQKTIKSANEKGLCVIIDVHNYAKYYSQPLQDDAALQDAFVDLWLRLAAVFTDANSTAFDLMNEPNYMSNGQWATLAKRTLAELRQAHAKNLVFIGGGHWSGLHDWFSERDGVSNASVFADIKDPLKRAIVEVHQYADQNHSGTGSDCRSADQFNDLFDKLSSWANENGQQLFLGEFGMAPSVDCLLTLERFLTLMNGPAWKGWSYWAAGSWWGGYPLAINTNAETPSPQWQLLKKYFERNLDNKSQPRPPIPKNHKR